MTTKCYKCGKGLTEKTAYKDKSRKSGLCNKCKVCDNEDRKIRKEKNKLKELNNGLDAVIRWNEIMRGNHNKYAILSQVNDTIRPVINNRLMREGYNFSNVNGDIVVKFE